MERFLKTKQVLKYTFVCMLFRISLYTIHYLILPQIYYIGPKELGATFLVIGISTVLVSGIGMWQTITQLRYWLITIPLYYGLISFYCPKDLYGINYYDYMFGTLASTPIIVIVVWVLIVEICIWIIIKIVKKQMK